MVNMAPWLISKDEIMAIAIRKGWFSVPRYLYRAEKMALKVKALVKEGRLRRCNKLSSSKEVVYVPTEGVSDENPYHA